MFYCSGCARNSFLIERLASLFFHGIDLVHALAFASVRLSHSFICMPLIKHFRGLETWPTTDCFFFFLQCILHNVCSFMYRISDYQFSQRWGGHRNTNNLWLEMGVFHVYSSGRNARKKQRNRELDRCRCYVLRIMQTHRCAIGLLAKSEKACCVLLFATVRYQCHKTICRQSLHGARVPLRAKSSICFVFRYSNCTKWQTVTRCCIFHFLFRCNRYYCEREATTDRGQPGDIFPLHLRDLGHIANLNYARINKSAACERVSNNWFQLFHFTDFLVCAATDSGIRQIVHVWISI